MEMYDWLMEGERMRGEWNIVMIDNGLQPARYL